MFEQFEPTVTSTIKFLRLHGIKVNKSTVNETLQNHPDWPSILCISDSLSKWKVPNGAGQIDKSLIDELPTPFIAHTSDPESPLPVVVQVDQDYVTWFGKSDRRPVVESRENFLKKWHGVYLIAEPNEESGDQDYATKRRKEILHQAVPVGASILILCLLLFILHRNMVSIDTSIYVQFFLCLLGIGTTTLLLWYEIDRNNPFLQKVCKGLTKSSCNAILTGKHAKVFSWLSWSEVGFFFFCGGLLSVLFVPNGASFQAWLNLLALPYCGFSIYYQWRIAKQWCGLCLVVQGVILAGAANALINIDMLQVTRLSALDLAAVLAVFILPALLWYTVKPYVLALQEIKTTKREYLRTKFNGEIFDTLIRKQKAIDMLPEGLGIELGNPEATKTIVKVCNPYCGPCATIHPKLEALLENNPDVKAKIIFVTAGDPNDFGYRPVTHFMAIAEKGDANATRQALDDWYLSEKKDYDVFAKKYPMNGELKRQGEKLQEMADWCKKNAIEFTPTIFVNGRQLPDSYTIDDLNYFLLD